MTDRPILFSGPMVRALLDGRKTQTRRVFKGVEQLPGGWHIFGAGGGALAVRDQDIAEVALDYVPYSVGDRLYVREGFTGVRPYGSGPDTLYRADGGPDCFKWKPGIHMPRSLSRLTLIVTDVRVQRLQEISEDDALAEGVPGDDDYAGSFAKEYCHHCGGSSVHSAFGEGYGVIEVDCAECETPKLRYRNLWDSLNASRGFGWDANPWVVAVSFTVERRNIDEVVA